ncbi:hypothetical protein CcCBS67573_g10491 [Chytriomyces confervae]|uniref:Uncharacterized protein n=1 Tax=Chytriomyces confervae TaxID=246404 RepID=A0A507CUM4_9FUNG|nr:hypothetical protein CcCBS67573_g10491 [Chytriomyces confervae]
MTTNSTDKAGSRVLATPRLRLVPVDNTTESSDLTFSKQSELIAAARAWLVRFTGRSGRVNPAGTGHLWVLMLAPTQQNTSTFNFIGVVELSLPRTSVPVPSTISPTGSLPSALPAVADIDDADFDLEDSFSVAESLAPDCPVLASFLDEEFCGLGYSTEAVKAILLHVFKPHPSSAEASFDLPPKIQSLVAASNPVKDDAERVLERLGFCASGFVTPSLKRDGTPKDTWTIWEIERDGFLELWTA